VTLLLTLLIMVVIGLVAAVAAGRIGGGLDDPASSLPGRGLPPGRFTLRDVDRVRFSPALRGYRMDEVDDVVDRLVDEVRRLEDEVAALRYRGGEDQSGPDHPAVTHPVAAHPAASQAHAAGEYGPGDGWADGYGDFRRPTPAIPDDDGAGER
jgi:DivIVA domain-containing protein